MRVQFLENNTSPNGQKKSAKSKTADLAYAEIRAQIVSGHLRPGEPLIEAELAEMLEISRTPVREALYRLRVEGLVVLQRYYRHYVRQFTIPELEEIFQIRAMLESALTARAALRINSVALVQLEELHQKMISEVKNDGSDLIPNFSRLNKEFHSLIWDATANSKAEYLLSHTLEVPINPVGQLDTRDRLKRFTRACAYHGEIIRALKSSQPEWASSVMKAHVLSLVPSVEQGIS